jgi:hypothetical protein
VWEKDVCYVTIENDLNDAPKNSINLMINWGDVSIIVLLARVNHTTLCTRK